jgi:hypothetical protein
MQELTQYCNQPMNTPDHCQARVLRTYLIASLLGGDTQDVRFYRDGVCFRHAMFS